MNRRRFLTISTALLAAPAIVRAGSIMPVKVPAMAGESLFLSIPPSYRMAWIKDASGPIVQASLDGRRWRDAPIRSIVLRSFDGVYQFVLLPDDPA